MADLLFSGGAHVAPDATRFGPSAPSPTLTLSQSQQAELDNALAELQASEIRVYYDKTKDIQDRDTYFAGIDAQAEPGELFKQLGRLLRTTHNYRPTYKPSKYVYPWVDVRPDGKVHSIYSDFAYDAASLILDDFRIEGERSQRVATLLAQESARDLAALQEQLDGLEAALPYNCEHSVPQSWFGKQEPMRGDLHHLFACECNCNSFRGNHAYFDFEDYDRAIRNDCGKCVENRFEPASKKGKGAVARATLYFLLRYPGLIAAAGGELDDERLSMLQAWHKQWLPDEYEFHRNMAIFNIQGNRNPLIDFPDWVEKIDFRLGFGL